MALYDKHPVEALLRPPVEFSSALVAGSAAVIAYVAPWSLMMTPSLGFFAGTMLAWLAAIRVRDGLIILNYHSSLKRLPAYTLRAKQIPVSKQRLFLGRGFRWGQKHTQRLRDTLRSENRKYVEPTASYRWARQKSIDWERKPLLSSVAKILDRDAWWNPLRPYPPVGGRPAIHAVEWEEQDVYMPLGERVGHSLVLGTTRVGKTRFAEILIAQDIRRGDVVIVFDPKGDADLLKRCYAEASRAGRLDNFYVFHLGYPELSARYNGVGQFSRITEVPTRIARQLSGEGNSAAFKQFAWRFINVVARALVSLGQRPNYELILQYITNIEPLFQDYCQYFFSRDEFKSFVKKTTPAWASAGWQQALIAVENGLTDKNIPINLRSRARRTVALIQFIKDNRIFDPVLDGLRSAVEYDKTYFDKITASLLPLLEKLTTGKISELLSPDYLDLNDTRPIIDWMKIIRQKGIVYIGLDALTDSEVSSVVGNSMFADIVSHSGYIYKHGTEHGLIDEKKGMPTISFHADEVNELMGDEFIPMVNKAGGSGMQVTAYTQTISDIEAKLASKAKAGQAIGNFNNLFMLRVKELTTAELLTKQLPKVEVNFLVQVSGVSDANSAFSGQTFTSRNEDRISSQMVPMIEPSDIIGLPKGQAFALIEGGQLWKLRMPLPAKEQDIHMPGNLSELAARMEKDYRGSSDSWWQPARQTLSMLSEQSALHVGGRTPHDENEIDPELEIDADDDEYLVAIATEDVRLGD